MAKSTSKITASKPIMDVAKPGKVAAEPTARPIIVSKGAIMKDPMVNEAPKEKASEFGVAAEEEKLEPLKQTIKRSKTIAPLSDEAKAEEATSEPSTETDQPEDEATTDEKPDESDAPPEVSDEAVIDAVAEQVDLGKKQKQEDREAVAHKEAIAKLVAEKKYVLPIKQRSGRKSNKGALVTLLILLLGLAGTYVAADMGAIKLPFELPVRFFQATEPTDAAVEQTVVPTKTPVTATAASVTSTTKDGITTYTNKDLAVSFAFPSTWGDVSMAKQESSLKKGHTVSFAFSKQPLVVAGMFSRDYDELGRGGACYEARGIYPTKPFSELKAEIKEGENITDNDEPFSIFVKLLKTTADTLIYEQFETGDAPLDPCPGLTARGYKSFASNSKYTGIEFFWGDKTTATKQLPLSDLAKYKANPNNYFADVDRKAFIAVVESAKIL